ncbi:MULTISPECIES: hypothetical protein [Sorangium]|uniref:hypothetical protein n=1 Tax=Sorangium TaxID=39643 RepID=UPI001A915094|nr:MULTISPECIES: hypothetical protein [Sorangium]
MTKRDEGGDAVSSTSTAQRYVTFIQDDTPPLRTGTYVVTAEENIPNQSPGTFSAQATLVVSGERFSLAPEDIASVFPPNLANGELDGVLPHVVLRRRTLPWERMLKNGDSTYNQDPWLAVLVLADGENPIPAAMLAKDLVPAGTVITVKESNVTGTGTLPASILSYGAATLNPMGYGETPDDRCTVIDLPLATWNKVAPSAADVQYLAHIREVDTTEGVDSATTTELCAVVMANRIPSTTAVTHAFLVSLENMADYLPADDGGQSPSIPAGTTAVRLLCYRAWSFTANTMDQTLEALLTNLNRAPDSNALSTLALPLNGPPPSAAEIQRALANQALGTLSTADAAVLVQQALMLGYVPMTHHLRHGGQTVSFYRGPLLPAPNPAPPRSAALYSGPDAANAYNPDTGMFDVSYGAAWQLGQLLMLQATGVANALYRWKLSVIQSDAVAAEEALLQARLGGAKVFPSFLEKRAVRAAGAAPPLPPEVLDWLAQLATLTSVPFNYLVPDERMLPPESIRFFYVDEGYVDALLDGAFSVGRRTASAGELETVHAPRVRLDARRHMRTLRKNDPRSRAAWLADPAPDANGPITGFLLRSAAVSGWPNLRFRGFSDGARTTEIPRVAVRRLSDSVTMALFRGVLGSLLIQEPPEQLHSGVELGPSGTYFTTLREVNPPTPGRQYTTNPTTKATPCDPSGTRAVACVTTRADGQTLQVASAAATIASRLTGDFGQTLPNGVTSAEWALEMSKGVVEVAFAEASS